MSCSERTTLVDRGRIRIEHCDCGVLHLDLGHLTLRLDPKAVTELHDALGEALLLYSLLDPAEQEEAPEIPDESLPRLRLLPDLDAAIPVP